jgi:hypothetical protein
VALRKRLPASLEDRRGDVDNSRLAILVSSQLMSDLRSGCESYSYFNV